MNVRISKKNQGSLFILLAMIIFVAGIIATRIIPNEDVRQKRVKSNILRLNIGEIRQAMILKRLASPTYNPQLGTSASITQEIKSLAAEHYIRSENLRDETVPAYLWSESGKYWKGVNNIASNCSFEITDTNKIASWTIVTGSNIATNSYFLFNSDLDDFPDENKLGEPFRYTGSTLEILQ